MPCELDCIENLCEFKVYNLSCSKSKSRNPPRGTQDLAKVSNPGLLQAETKKNGVTIW